MSRSTQNRDLGSEVMLLYSRLAARRRAIIARTVLSVMISAAVVAGAVTAFAHAAAAGWRYAPLLDFVVFWGMIAAAAVWVSVEAARRYRQGGSLADIAGERSGRGSLFSAAVEFAGGGERLRPYSAVLIDRTMSRAAGELGKISPERMFSDLSKPGWTLAGILAGIVLVVQVNMPSSDLGGMIRAVSDPSAAFREKERFNLVPGRRDIRVIAGDDATVEAAKLGSRKGEVSVRYSSVPGVWATEKVDPVQADAGYQGPVLYRHTFRSVTDDISFVFTAGGEESLPGRITVIHPPVVNRISARLVYPAYTGAKPDTIKALAGKIAALKGTRVYLEGETSKPVASAEIFFASGRTGMLECAAGGFEGSFAVTRDDTMRIQVTDSTGLKSDMALAYPVRVLEDTPPAIDILSPDDGEQLPRSMEIKLSYRAYDDFGISYVRLYHMKEGRDPGYRMTSLLPPADGARKSVEDSWSWSLSGENVFPGDRILYYLEAADNREQGGPNRTKTRVRVLVVPSLADIYAEARKDESDVGEKAESIIEDSKEVRDRLRQLADDFRSEGKMDWEKKSEGQKIASIQEELRKKISEAADGIDKALERLEQNRMTSMEIGRKIEEIQKLLSEIENDDLHKSIERLRDLMSKVPEKDMARALEQMEADAGKMSDRLDRTIELLKRVLMDQKMEEMVRRMESMLDDQSALRDSTSTGDLEELSERQKDLADEYKRFEEDMNRFGSELPEDKKQAGFDEVLGKMTEARIDSLMSEAYSRLRDQLRDKAGAAQNETVDKMTSLYTRLGKCQMVMSMQADKETIKMVEDATREIIEVSKLQEKSLPLLDSPGASSGDIGQILEHQNVVRDAVGKIVEKLIEAGRKDMAVSNDVFIHLGTAVHSLNTAIEDVRSRRVGQARVSMAKVPGELNLAAVELLRSGMSSGGSGGSMQQQMQMMTERQSSIDDQLKNMMEAAEQEQMSMRARSEMARLAAEQRQLGDMMKKMMEESSGAGELLGRLGDIGDDMKEIASELDKGRLDQDLAKREERILSRMLESQRSLNRRDYSRQRKSTTAGDIRAAEGGELPAGPEDRDVLLERIRNAMREKGPAEYEELIRAYFRALSVKVRDEDSQKE